MQAVSKHWRHEQSSKTDAELELYDVTVQSKDEEKSSQKSATESSIVVDDSQISADQDDLACGAGGLEASTGRSGSTSERRVTRASARSQQQRGRSTVDGMIPTCFVAMHFSYVMNYIHL